MNTVILTSEHLRIVRQLKRRSLLVHLCGVVLVVGLLAYPYVLKVENDLVLEAYGVAKIEFRSALIRLEMLRLFRTKALTIGQALDVVDIVLAQTDVPIAVVLAVMSQESEFSPNAISNKGAQGLMQVLPINFKYYSNHPLLKGNQHMQDPIQNVRTGVMLLGDLYRRFQDWSKVFRSYYAGPEQANNKAYDWYAKSVMKKAQGFGLEIGRKP